MKAQHLSNKTLLSNKTILQAVALPFGSYNTSKFWWSVVINQRKIAKTIIVFFWCVLVFSMYLR